MQTRVYLLYTGGTLGMGPKDAADPQSPLEPKPLADWLQLMPGFAGSRFDSATSQTEFKLANGNSVVLSLDSIQPIDSSDITPAHWRQIALKIRDVYDDYDGFVILHGTDTMAYTSSALSFMLQNLAKPVVLTGAQLPIANIRTDASLNLANALHIAAYQAAGIPLIPEVVIVFADKVLRGNRASKISPSRYSGFASPNYPSLGTLGGHIAIDTGRLLPPPDPAKTFQVDTTLEEQVFALTLFPGITRAPVHKLFLDAQVKGIVLRTYGAGNAPGDPAFLQTIGQSIRGDIGDAQGGVKQQRLPEGRTIVSVSQCLEGTVEMGLYQASSGLQECGVLSGLDMTPEAALTKLMWVLGTRFGTGRATQMQINQCGELTEKSAWPQSV